MLTAGKPHIQMLAGFVTFLTQLTQDVSEIVWIAGSAWTATDFKNRAHEMIISSIEGRGQGSEGLLRILTPVNTALTYASFWRSMLPILCAGLSKV
jgi:hypothetical protein